MLATKKMRQVRRLIADAWKEIMVDARGPKCLVMMSMHIKDSQDIKIPPSNAMYSFWTRVLLASKFIEMTLTTKRDTTTDGMLLNSSVVSFFSWLSQLEKDFFILYPQKK